MEIIDLYLSTQCFSLFVFLTFFAILFSCYEAQLCINAIVYIDGRSREGIHCFWTC